MQTVGDVGEVGGPPPFGEGPLCIHIRTITASPIWMRNTMQRVRLIVTSNRDIDFRAAATALVPGDRNRVGATRFERATSKLAAWRSFQLSYAPIFF